MSSGSTSCYPQLEESEFTIHRFPESHLASLDRVFEERSEGAKVALSVRVIILSLAPLRWTGGSYSAVVVAQHRRFRNRSQKKKELFG
jgi:S-adenosylmethionine/arginine decarboxylase-like enzyme